MLISVSAPQVVHTSVIPRARKIDKAPFAGVLESRIGLGRESPHLWGFSAFLLFSLAFSLDGDDPSACAQTVHEVK
jgi:hypothetical protein